MIQASLPWLADLLLIFGLVISTIAVYGLIWMPDIYLRLHAASKTAIVGLTPFLLAAATTGEPAIIFRVILIGIFLLLTTPVAAHVIARDAYLLGEPMETPGAADESRRLKQNG
ncbi:MAG: monovalent cation/H(+) antiporter subunit G [Chloroflexota bacterium]|nr:monovalent cation/H(+) antiporter subunit G [Chloroflexota bacterium]